jgi:hypothetical protein
MLAIAMTEPVRPPDPVARVGDRPRGEPTPAGLPVLAAPPPGAQAKGAPGPNLAGPPPTTPPTSWARTAASAA